MPINAAWVSNIWSILHIFKQIPYKIIFYAVSVAVPLKDLHIKLMRKNRKTVHEKSWESALSKFCFSYSAQDAWEIERFGYKNASLKVKLKVLKVGDSCWSFAK